jgi:twitching motility protein PilT
MEFAGTPIGGLMSERHEPAINPDLHRLLMEAVRRQASDLHLAAGQPPTCRVHGRLERVARDGVDGRALTGWLQSVCPAAKWAVCRQQFDVDFSFELPEGQHRHRFRANFFHAGGQPGACFRLVPSEIPTLDWARFPAALAARLTRFLNGLVLVTGVTGSGKTTTLAMLVNELCAAGSYRIITIEDPVEYIFSRAGNSFVTQREVGVDVATFSDGLKYGLRQDPDVILVGEIRDRDTAQMALSAAETGHLVLSTMHTRDARGAITRYADLFPQSVQGEIRAQLAMSLRGVVSQHLVPSTAEDGRRALALEVMFNTLPVASAIRLGKVEALDNSILTGRAEGMIPLDESLRLLVESGAVTAEVAKRYSKHAN